jgi:hypothetical protein
VPGQRRHHQHHRVTLEAGQHVRPIAVTLEAEQAAEGMVELDALDDPDLLAADTHRVDAEGRLLVALPQPVEELPAGRHRGGARHPGQPALRRREHVGGGLRHLHRRAHQGPVHLVKVIQRLHVS